MAKILLTTATLDGPMVGRVTHANPNKLPTFHRLGTRRVVTLELRIDVKALLNSLGRKAAIAKTRRAVEANGLIEVVATNVREVPDTVPAGTELTPADDTTPMISDLRPPVVDASLRT